MEENNGRKYKLEIWYIDSAAPKDSVAVTDKYVDDYFFFDSGAIFAYTIDNQRYYLKAKDIECIKATVLFGFFDDDQDPAGLS